MIVYLYILALIVAYAVDVSHNFCKNSYLLMSITSLVFTIYSLKYSKKDTYHKHLPFFFAVITIVLLNRYLVCKLA